MLERMEGCQCSGKRVFSTVHTLYRLGMVVSGHTFMFTNLILSFGHLDLNIQG